MKKNNHELDGILLNSSLILLGFLCLDHLFVIATFLTSHALLPIVVPFSLVISILIYLYIERTKSRSEKSWTIITSLSVLVISFFVSMFYFDLSWDGQWYHQSAIYNLESGWNPLREPIREFEKNNDLSILHFPKFTWYYAASVYSAFGYFEAGKSINFILLFASFFYISNRLKQMDFSGPKAFLISLLVVLNPVVWSEITTYLVDGVLYLYLCLYSLSVMAWFRYPDHKSLLVGTMAIIGLVNVKFTGLVFLCILVFAVVLYLSIQKRSLMLRFIGFHVLAFVLAIFIFGYNPYISNYTERGHPLYPIIGTEEYPSVFEQKGRDDNEVLETPHNMIGRSLVVRLFYSTFGRPDNAPYHKEKEAELIWPFTSRISDWRAYHFHETRVSGFGPYFGGILILSVILIPLSIKKNKKHQLIQGFFFAALFGSLLFSKHFWWPRFVPHIWLIPLIPLVFSFYHDNSRKMNFYNWFLALLIVLNGSIVLISHMGWETASSIRLRQQLTELSEKEVAIEIGYGWFMKSMEEKLHEWKINFTPVPRSALRNEDYEILTSVVEGYPNSVMYREQKKPVSSEDQSLSFK